MADIERIKQQLKPYPRDYCLFVVGINTGFRGGELLSLTCGQVATLCPGDHLEIWQSKTGKMRGVTVNKPAAKALKRWYTTHPSPSAAAPLFVSRTGRVLTGSTLCNMVKKWCEDAGLVGQYSSHTLRKTWGYQALRRSRGVSKYMILPILMQAYGHATQDQTLQYLCVQSDEIANLFMTVEI
ncbi:MAG: tyrosine-type recombinase/integrase [Pseudomonadota bacterium]